MTYDQYRTGFRTSLSEFAAATAFLTRLPAGWMGVAADRRPDFTVAARAFPAVGLLVGLVGVFALLLAHALGMPLLASAALSLAATVALTGALHEDGLADTADGFGGGTTATRKLEIMRDSRIGTFGAVALVLSLLLRATLVANLLPYGPWPVATALIGAEIVSRSAIVHLWSALPPARFEGLASATGRPSRDTGLTAIGLAIVAALVCGAIGSGILPAVIALVVAGLATYAFQLLCAAQIAGQTGDTLGAVQQIALVTYLMAIVAAA